MSERRRSKNWLFIVKGEKMCFGAQDRQELVELCKGRVSMIFSWCRMR